VESPDRMRVGAPVGRRDRGWNLGQCSSGGRRVAVRDRALAIPAFQEHRPGFRAEAARPVEGADPPEQRELPKQSAVGVTQANARIPDVSRLRPGAVAFDDPEAAPRSQLLDIGEADVRAAATRRRDFARNCVKRARMLSVTVRASRR
jgi:hypothetical protein